MIAVSVRGLTKSFGIHTVLKNVDLTLREGERIGLVGVNGSGKSTLRWYCSGKKPRPFSTPVIMLCQE